MCWISRGLHCHAEEALRMCVCESGKRLSAFLPSGVEKARRAGRHHAPPSRVWGTPSEGRVPWWGGRRRRAMPVMIKHTLYTQHLSLEKWMEV